MSRGRCRPLRGAGVVVALISLSRPAWAVGWPDDASKTLPCRPTIACTADLVPAGALELELGTLLRKVPGGANDSVPVLLKLTLLEDLQLQMGTGTAFFYAADRPKSFLDGFAGVKWRMAHQTAWVPALSISALATTAEIPADGTSAYGASVTAYITKDIGWLHADLNFGSSGSWLASSFAHQEFAALALSRDLAGGVSWMVEGYGFTDASFAASKDAGILSALAYAPRPFVMFDVGGDVALFPSTRSFSVFAGLSVIVARLWEAPPRSPP